MQPGSLSRQAAAHGSDHDGQLRNMADVGTAERTGFTGVIERAGEC